MTNDALVADLRRIVGDAQTLTAADVTEAFRTDWTGRYRADEAIVVRPADTTEVAAVVRACAAHGATICPQGGNTGLVGGSVPLSGEVVVSTRRLTKLAPVDVSAGTVVAGAGVTLGDLQRHVRASGFEYGVDLGARDSATLGGTIATNAGGIHVIRRGMTRDQLVGIEAVLADGSVVGDLAGLPKDNTGFHLPGLFCGSEGTIGIVTTATVRLHRILPERITALIAFDSVAAAIAAIVGLGNAHLPIDAVEFMLDGGFELVSSSFGLSSPFEQRHPAYLVVECSDAVPVSDRLAEVLDRLDGVDEAAVAEGGARRDALWAHRELHTEAIAGIGPPVKLDVTVPLRRLGEFVNGVRDRVESELPDTRVWLFGHAGDGNVHVNVTGVADADTPRCVAAVLGYVIELGGSISAEHGIGRLKKDWLVAQRGEPTVAAFRSITSALDPNSIFQPELLLPDAFEPDA